MGSIYFLFSEYSSFFLYINWNKNTEYSNKIEPWSVTYLENYSKISKLLLRYNNSLYLL